MDMTTQQVRLHDRLDLAVVVAAIIRSREAAGL